jgi:hypothetical protein
MARPSEKEELLFLASGEAMSRATRFTKKKGISSAATAFFEARQRN